MVPPPDSRVFLQGSSRDAELGYGEVPEVRVSPATPRRDVKGKGKEKAREVGRGSDVGMVDGVAGVLFGFSDWTADINVVICSSCLLDRSPFRRRSSQSRSRSTSTSSPEDGEDRKVVVRMPPKLRKGWIRKGVDASVNGTENGRGKDKDKEGDSMDVDTDGREGASGQFVVAGRTWLMRNCRWFVDFTTHIERYAPTSDACVSRPHDCDFVLVALVAFSKARIEGNTR